MRYRIDLRARLVADLSGPPQLVLEPDPGRYTWRRLGERLVLVDTIDGLTFPADRVTETLAGSVPAVFCEPLEAPAPVWVLARRQAVGRLLDAPPPLPRPDGPGAGTLKVFLVAALLGSDETPPAATAVALHEWAQVVRAASGRVLQVDADRLVAGFGPHGGVRPSALAVDCALLMRSVLRQGINPVLEARGWPTLDARIALVGSNGDHPIGPHGMVEDSLHVLSDMLLQARPGEVLVGTGAADLRAGVPYPLTPAFLGRGWSYRRPDGDVYRVYRLTSANGVR